VVLYAAGRRGGRAVGQEVQHAGDSDARRGASEELQGVEAVEVDEDAADLVREEQAPAIDDGATCPADAARRGVVAGREAAQDGGQRVVGQQVHQVLRLPLRPAVHPPLPDDRSPRRQWWTKVSRSM